MLRRKLAILVVLVLCLQLLLPTLPSLALTEPYNLSRLTAESGAIVWGHVLDVVPHWNADQTCITSTVTLSAVQYLKGAGEAKLTIETPGGEVDGISQWVEDAPVFAAGEEVILFLDANQTAVLGWDQGKFSCVDHCVVEQEMMPLGQFIGQIQAELRAQGYASPEAAAEKGLSTPVRQEFVSAVFDPATDTFVELAADDADKGVASTELDAVRDDDAYSIIKSETWEGIWPGTGWTRSGSPTWDDTSYRRFNGSWSAWCADTTLSPPGPYSNNMNAWMIYGPFSLVGATDADMWFWHWTKTEANYDWLSVMASTNGSSFYGWKISGNYTDDAGNVNGWMKGDFNLTNVYTLGDLRGQPNVWIAFRFTSDSSITYEGSYIDDMVIWKASGTGNPPVINNVNPTSRAAGINQQVTIYGRSFGATQGTSTVKFWWSGSTWSTASIVSWSDSKIVCRVPAPASSHSSQAIRVTTSGGSAYFGFNIKWGYMGIKWPGTPVMKKYYIGSGTADCTGENQAIQAAANTWNNVAFTMFSLKYYGTTSRSAPVYDGYNVLRFGSTSGSIATCTTWYSGSNILEFDIVFNDAYLWNSSATCPSDRMDVQNIATHEFGHGFGLLDLYGSADSEKTMYGYGANGETKKRSLHSEDMNGIRWIYP